MNKVATRAIVIDVPELAVTKMKEYIESSGHYKYIVHDAAPIYRDMVMFHVLNGFHEHEIDWSDTINMEDFVKCGAVVLIGPRTEPGMWQHPDYTGLTETGNKLITLCRESMKMSEELFNEPTNLVDLNMLKLEASHKGISHYLFDLGLRELLDKGKCKLTKTKVYIEMTLCGK